MERGLAGAEEAHGQRQGPELKRRLVVPGVDVERLAPQELAGDGRVPGFVAVPVRLEERRQPRQDEDDQARQRPPAREPGLPWATERGRGQSSRLRLRGSASSTHPIAASERLTTRSSRWTLRPAAIAVWADVPRSSSAVTHHSCVVPRPAGPWIDR